MAEETIVYVPMAVVTIRVQTNPMLIEFVKPITVTIQNAAGITDSADMKPGGEFNFLVEPGEWLASASILGVASEYKEIFVQNGEQKTIVFQFGQDSAEKENMEEIDEVIEASIKETVEVGSGPSVMGGSLPPDIRETVTVEAPPAGTAAQMEEAIEKRTIGVDETIIAESDTIIAEAEPKASDTVPGEAGA